MGILEKEIIMYVLGWLLRWFTSNEKNKIAKAKLDESRREK